MGFFVLGVAHLEAGGYQVDDDSSLNLIFFLLLFVAYLGNFLFGLFFLVPLV